MALMPPDSPPHCPRALLLDMDGTLTEPMLDFPAIKRELGIGDRPILESMAAMNAEDRRRADAILYRHEEAAAGGSTLAAGCRELLAWADAHRMPAALVTRNSRMSANTVLARHGLKLDLLITRDDAPHKPHPDPLHLACKRLGMRCDQVWMVGDGRYDIEAAAAAGIRGVWISLGRERPFAAKPWWVVKDLLELIDLLEQRVRGQAVKPTAVRPAG